MPVTGARGFFLGEGEWPFRGFVVLQGDSVFAYANVCPHARHPLDLQPDEFLVETGDMLRCSSHGALFRPQTGECVFGPCVGQNLLALNVRIDQAGVIHVTAPASMRDARFARWNR
jgi:nitrite reductase/ring-hydroxylating ferredoxin subunit